MSSARRAPRPARASVPAEQAQTFAEQLDAAASRWTLIRQQAEIEEQALRSLAQTARRAASAARRPDPTAGTGLLDTDAVLARYGLPRYHDAAGRKKSSPTLAAWMRPRAEGGRSFPRPIRRGRWLVAALDAWDIEEQQPDT
jgi:hypothetical protein